MELIRGDYSLPSNPRPCVVAVGGFDSLHLGHRAVIGEALARANEMNVPATVIFFEPLPFEFFNEALKRGACARVNLLRARVNILAGMGVPRALCLRFNRRVASMTPEQFIRRVLIDGLAVKHVVVGKDFRFGYRGAGTAETLREAGGKNGFSVSEVATVKLDGTRVSSSAVRAALSAGDIAAAERCLARPYIISARVGYGVGRGGDIGFPTANLILKHPPPLRGVFAADVSAGDKRHWRAVVNAGEAPTFKRHRYKIEAHILELRERLYAKRLALRFLKKIRDECKFDSAAQLKEQIKKDIEAAVAAEPPDTNRK